MNQDAKKTLLRHIPHGLYVIGVTRDGQVNAFTGSWLTQVSFQPPRIVFAVNRKAHSFGMLKAGRVFSVNFIRTENQATIEHFFRPPQEGKTHLEGMPYTLGETGSPILDEALGYIECTVSHFIDDGADHAVVMGEVTVAELREDVVPLQMADTSWHYGG